MTKQTIPTMTQKERDDLRARCDHVISEAAEILKIGDVTEDDFKRLCHAASSAAIVRAAVTSWEEYE